MLNPIIQTVANLITDDIDPALRRVYEDIVMDLEKARDALSQPAEPAPAPEGPAPEAEDDQPGLPAAPAPIPPVGEAVQDFQPQPGAGEAETLQQAPSAPVAAEDLAADQSGVSELVGSLQASHEAAKADVEPDAAPIV